MAVPRQKSASVLHRRSKGRKRSDERVRRTRARIDAAFVELLHRRPYGSIRVSDITRKALVGRATFYAHYSDKDDLLRSQFERVVAPMLSISKDSALLDATAFFDHVRNVRFIYEALMGPAGGSAPRVLRHCFVRRARKALSFERSTKVGLEDFAAPRLVASTIITVAECWMEQGFRETNSVRATCIRLVCDCVCHNDFPNSDAFVVGASSVSFTKWLAVFVCMPNPTTAQACGPNDDVSIPLSDLEEASPYRSARRSD